jgi:hypothetical protein
MHAIHRPIFSQRVPGLSPRPSTSQRMRSTRAQVTQGRRGRSMLLGLGIVVLAWCLFAIPSPTAATDAPEAPRSARCGASQSP